MGFVEIAKSKRNTGRRAAPATFSRNKKGTASLRINAAGLDFIAQKNIGLEAGDKIKIFFDRESGKVGLQKNPEGKFRLCKNDPRGNSLRITAAELAVRIPGTAAYEVEEGKDMDLVLVPKG